MRRRQILKVGVGTLPYWAFAAPACSDDGGESQGGETGNTDLTDADLSAQNDAAASASDTQSNPTDSSGDDALGDGASATCQATASDIEGPFFSPDSPMRNTIVAPGAEGQHFALAGRVVDSQCRPITNAIVDFWQADLAGDYDNVGFNFRGHQLVDANGFYRLRTIVPGRYLNGATFRPAHIHVKVFVEGTVRLTTQIYFADDPYNASDQWYKDSNAVSLMPAVGGGMEATFDFAV